MALHLSIFGRPIRFRRSSRGTNLFGYFRAESGVGEHARTLLAVLDEARVPVVPVDFGDTRSRKEHPLPIGAALEPRLDHHVICVNADQTPHFMGQIGRQRLGSATRVGYWHWEVEEFPDWMAASARHLDAIWTASEHSAAAIRRKVDKPVSVLSPAVDPPLPSLLPEGILPEGPGPLVLTSFDYDSVLERKNPIGAILAFRRAFPQPGSARLLVKSVNGPYFPDARQCVAEAADGRADIKVLDQYLSRTEQAALIHACDLFFSPHRAEGFGLMLAEAMSAGKPVVATGYSGNLEFMSESSGVLVPWKYSPIPAGAGPYTGQWADPDLDAAAAALRSLAGTGDRAKRFGERAQSEVRAKHGVRARAVQVRAALARSWGAPERTPAVTDPDEFSRERIPVPDGEELAAISQRAKERRAARPSSSLSWWRRLRDS